MLCARCGRELAQGNTCGLCRPCLISAAATLVKERAEKRQTPYRRKPEPTGHWNVGRCAIYRLFDEEGELLYVGVSNDPYRRLRDHRRKFWGKVVASVTVEWFDTRIEAQRAEIWAICDEEPSFNQRIG